MEKAMAAHSSTLAWKTHGYRSPVGCRPWGRRVGHDWATSLSLFTFMHWRGKWQPTPVFLPGESQGWGAWWAAVYGVGHDWSDLAAAAAAVFHCICTPYPNVVAKGEIEGGGKLGVWASQTQTTVYKIGKQQGYTVQHRKLYLLFCYILQ